MPTTKPPSQLAQSFTIEADRRYGDYYFIILQNQNPIHRERRAFSSEMNARLAARRKLRELKNSH